MTALSLSELSRRATDVKRLLAESPVVVTDNGHGIGALIGLDLWAQVQEWLDDEEDNRAADAMLAQIQAGEETYSHMNRLSEPSLLRVWDNDPDAEYDNWRELYGVSEG